MVKLYNLDVNSLFEFSKPKDKTSLNDIYAQVYNVGYETAVKMTNEYNSKTAK